MSHDEHDQDAATMAYRRGLADAYAHVAANIRGDLGDDLRPVEIAAWCDEKAQQHRP